MTRLILWVIPILAVLFSLITFDQKSFQHLLPAMITVIGQCVESGDEDGARKLFDVFETLLVLVSSFFFPSFVTTLDSHP